MKVFNTEKKNCLRNFVSERFVSARNNVHKTEFHSVLTSFNVHIISVTHHSHSLSFMTVVMEKGIQIGEQCRVCKGVRKRRMESDYLVCEPGQSQ